MLTARRSLLTLTALIAIASGGVLLGQMEAGNRGILPVDSSQTLEIGGIHVDVGGKSAAAARFRASISVFEPTHIDISPLLSRLA